MTEAVAQDPLLNRRIELKLPPGFDLTTVEVAVPFLAETMRTLKSCPNYDEAMRGYLTGTRVYGYPITDEAIKAATREELFEACCRSFWFAFEREAWSSPEARMLQ